MYASLRACTQDTATTLESINASHRRTIFYVYISVLCMHEKKRQNIRNREKEKRKRGIFCEHIFVQQHHHQLALAYLFLYVLLCRVDYVYVFVYLTRTPPVIWQYRAQTITKYFFYSIPFSTYMLREKADIVKASYNESGIKTHQFRLKINSETKLYSVQACIHHSFTYVWMGWMFWFSIQLHICKKKLCNMYRCSTVDFSSQLDTTLCSSEK